MYGKPCLYFTIVLHSLGIYCGLKKICKSLKTLVWNLIQRPLSHQFLEPFYDPAPPSLSTKLPSITLKKIPT